jgi:hypothetical protein
MDHVFRQAIEGAARSGWGAVAQLCLRELADAPAALVREWRSGLRNTGHDQEGSIVDGETITRGLLPVTAAREPEPRGQAVGGTLGLLVPGMTLALTELPALQPWSRELYLGAYLFVLFGVLAGWVRSFPRWSYAYVGYALVFSLYLSSVSTPGLQILGHTFQREPWAWRAWLGLGIAAALALAVTRSSRPVARLMTGVWRDWTRLSFAIYGTLPLALWILFDEVHSPYPALFLAVSALCLAAGAWYFVSAGSPWRRALSLIAGLTSSWTICTLAVAAYWSGRTVGRAQHRLEWADNAMPMAIGWVVVAATLLVPALLEVFRRSAGARSAM